jgi:hypothetical protein
MLKEAILLFRKMGGMFVISLGVFRKMGGMFVIL